jgi:hypothetical protein
MSMIAKRTGATNRVVLPDGREVSPNRATALGYTIESLNDQIERNTAARKARFAVTQRAGEAYDDAGAKPAQTKGQALIAYAQAIEDLPEAKSRPAAASEIWSKRTVQSMPVERAAAFLRGLPEEAAPVAKVASTVIDPKALAMFQRKCEIRILGLNMRADRGEHSARGEAQKLSWALRVRNETGCSYGEAFTGAGLDARATIDAIMGPK